MKAAQRKTSQRQAIEQVFDQCERPMGVEEILEAGQVYVPSLNQATVYRNLKLMVEGNWLKVLNHPELGTLYERAGKKHHHHFHCKDCNRVFELPGCPLKQELKQKDSLLKSGFIVEEHEVWLAGTCPECN